MGRGMDNESFTKTQSREVPRRTDETKSEGAHR